MRSETTRRDLLRGDFRTAGVILMRPPGAQPGFGDLCTDCGNCARACPQQIVRRAATGGPVIDFTLNPCSFCGDCARACPTGALKVVGQDAWHWRARTLDTCLSRKGIACRACEDACEPRAIRFRLETGGRAIPVLDAKHCTGCGECAATCPAAAITFDLKHPVAAEETA